MQIMDRMKQFMEPNSIAIVGVSRDTGKGTFNILENLLGGGYRGTVYPVNPNASEIMGIKTYPSVDAIPEAADLAVVATPRHLAPAMVGQCADKGMHSVIVVAQGFTDAGDDQGKQLQKEIDAMVNSGRARVLGPNTFGSANAFLNYSSSFVKIKLKKQPTGLICQSGVFFIGFPDMTLTGKGLDVGNACDISFGDGLEYFEKDADTKVVALHIEGMKDAQKFLSVARRVARKKPVVALKTGRSEQAAKAARSHTGSLTGKNEVWEAALRQSGVLQAADLQEFIDMARTFSALPLMKNPLVGIATITGGMGIMAVDGCRHGLEIARLSAGTKQKLGAISPAWLTINNPVDIWPAMIASQPFIKPLVNAVETLLSDQQLGAVMLIAGAFDAAWGKQLSQVLTELASAHPEKPLACCLYGPYAGEAIISIQEAGKLIAFPTPERAMRALGRLNEYSRLRGRL